MGREVLEILPIPPIALHLRTGIAMISYADRFSFGITADYDSAPDVDALASGIEDGVRRLAALGSSKRRTPSVSADRVNESALARADHCFAVQRGSRVVSSSFVGLWTTRFVTPKSIALRP